ncbi:DUF2271 domain-containing protein [Sphingobacterium sp. SRCM116780]|uniref:DUF2271 domain-containing protein n=1 Tax=Sphingobacterium sp. SRCM116780 TaxID=2907623 RepID=UPI001F398592|nr:DUF2271 domain-containing protein [Sphingobacterium sp. SRCM116780]UIR56611.1 DUF2271 domain-containing protein [Sphingobacterium sp. SRCM116780]
MKIALKFILLTFLISCSISNLFAQSSKYKCMIQMNSYEGEGAYVIISLINPKGAYEKTLSVLGPDKQWYNTLKEWHKFQTKSKDKLSAITGASVGGGDRAMRTIEIDDTKLNKGYKLRFESAVEEQKYHVSDVEIPLTTEALAERATGKGYIKFIKLSKFQ